MRGFGFIGMTALGAALLVGCASASGARSEPATGAAAAPARGMGMQGSGMMGGMCPMHVQGAEVTATDVEGGVALEFRTSAGDVGELRQRVRRMAEMHARHHASGGMKRGGGMMMMPAATATVEDIEGGARLILRPRDPARLDALRQHARMHAEHMASGECPMMSGSQGQAAPPPSTNEADHEAHHPSQPEK